MCEIPAQDDSEKARLLEIYKLQVQLTNDVSNRRTSTNRFYMISLSGVALVFSTVFDITGNGTNTFTDLSLELLAYMFATIGLSLSWSWFISTESYLRLVSRKYEVLKELEIKLDYNFFEKEWGYLGKHGNNLTYRELSRIELSPSIIFLAIFLFLLAFSASNIQPKVRDLWLFTIDLRILLFVYPPIVIFWFFTFNMISNKRRNKARKLEK